MGYIRKVGGFFISPIGWLLLFFSVQAAIKIWIHHYNGFLVFMDLGCNLFLWSAALAVNLHISIYKKDANGKRYIDINKAEILFQSIILFAISILSWIVSFQLISQGLDTYNITSIKGSVKIPYCFLLEIVLMTLIGSAMATHAFKLWEKNQIS